MNNKSIETQKTRFAYLDNVRSLVIFLVITIHAAVTYSGLGSWYYIEGSSDKLSVFEFAFFGFLQSFLQAWCMGLLFFVSAYFATKALAKRGTLKFIGERLFRLGLPLFLYVFIISPIIQFVILKNNPWNSFLTNYIYYISNIKWWLGETGHLWFVQVLLIFCIIYAILKKCIPCSIKVKDISSIKIILTILLVTIIAFFIRVKFPIGISFYNLTIGYFSSYIIMFIAGIIVGENNLLENITDEKNIKWFKITLIIALPLFFIVLFLSGALEGNMNYEGGGFYWQSFIFALWESLIAIGFSVGLISLFKKRVNVENKFTSLIQDNAFGMYFFHSPILIIISLQLRNLILNPILKFSLVLVITSIACLLFSFLIRKIKPIGVILK